MTASAVIVWPAQCNCGHIFMEHYQFRETNERGEIGFAWCGWCRTRRWVKPLGLSDAERRGEVQSPAGQSLTATPAAVSQEAESETSVALLRSRA